MKSDNGCRVILGGNDRPTSKACSACKETLPLSDFYADARATLGRMSRCKTCHCEAVNRCREKNPEWSIRYRQENHAEISRKKKEYVRANPDYAVRGLKVWRAKHREEANRQNRIAKQLHRDHDLREYVLARDGRACLVCGITADLCLDHIVPVSKGGENHHDNLQTLCRMCNSRKRGAVDHRRKTA